MPTYASCVEHPRGFNELGVENVAEVVDGSYLGNGAPVSPTKNVATIDIMVVDTFSRDGYGRMIPAFLLTRALVGNASNDQRVAGRFQVQERVLRYE